MENQISKERATEIIGLILEKREESKNIKAYITGAKEELESFMTQNDLTEFDSDKGSVKIADSMREGLVKASVESAVTKVNAKEIDHIDMKDLFKEIDIHSISLKAKKEAN